MQVDIIPDIEVIEHLDFDAKLRCEGALHATGTLGHVVTAPAAWVMTKPCCGGTILKCDGWVETQTALCDGFICGTCGKRRPVSEYRFSPIDSD
jgi:hypothetical protein